MVEAILYILSILLKVGIVPVVFLVYKKKLTFLQGLYTSAFLLLASFGCEVYYFNLTNGYSLIDSVVNTAFDELKASFGVDKGLTAEQAAAVAAAADSVRNLYFTLFPALIVCMNLISAYFWLMLSKGIFALCKKDVSGFMRFCDFKMSKTGVAAGAISFVLYGMMSGSRVSFAFLNIAVIILFATFVCGVSVADFKFRKRLTSSVARFMLYVMLSGFIFGLGMWILIILGVIDAFLNIRIPRRKPEDFDQQ